MGQTPPRMWSIVLTVLVTLWVLEDASSQVAFPPFTICFMPLIGGLLVVNYLFRLCWCPPPGWGHDPESCEPWRWFVLPVAVAVIFSTTFSPWPMFLRFSLSRSAFEAKVAELHRTGEDQGPQRVGLYWIDRIFVWPNGYVGFQTGASIIDPVGFSYDPSPSPPSRYNQPLGGDWYAREW